MGRYLCSLSLLACSIASVLSQVTVGRQRLSEFAWAVHPGDLRRCSPFHLDGAGRLTAVATTVSLTRRSPAPSAGAHPRRRVGEAAAFNQGRSGELPSFEAPGSPRSFPAAGASSRCPATWAIEQQAREIDVQFLLGHSTPAMLRRYAVTCDGEQAARRRCWWRRGWLQRPVWPSGRHHQQRRSGEIGRGPASS